MNLTVLSALAQTEDIQEFRLRDLMARLRMDQKQPALFYRQLVKEARDVIPLVDQLQKHAAGLEKANSQIKATVTSQQQQIASEQKRVAASEARIRTMEGEKRELKGVASELRESAENYAGIKELLRGEVDLHTLEALHHLVSQTYMQALEASIERNIGARSGRRSVPPDPIRLASIRERVRQDLRAVLRIPGDELEERLVKAEKTNEALKSFINQAFSPKRP